MQIILKDFSQKNIKGKSFIKQDLIGADFRGSDIRGANFENTNLCGANFTQSVAGQQHRWVLVLSVLTLTLSAIAGFISTYASGIISILIFVNDPEIFGPRVVTLGSSLLVLLVLVAFVIIALQRGLSAALGVFMIGIVTIVGIVAAGSDIDALAAVFVLQTVALSIVVAGSMISAFAFSMARIVVGNRFVYAAAATTVPPAIVGGLEGISSISRTSLILEDFIALTISGLIATALLGLGAYMSLQAKAEDSRYAIIQHFAIALSSLGGTTFRGADLTNSNFDEATLKKADLRDANLTRTSFLNSKGLSQARLKGTYLSNPELRQLAVSRDGHSKDFSHQNLRGINLQGSNLSECNFIGADLTSSNLQQADLSKAKLARTQLYEADLSGSSFTGAFIEDWGISTNTRLEGVKCRYVHMRLPTPDDPDPCRKPDNKQEDFKSGDFEVFIAPILKTLDLYQQQNIDPRRIAETYKTVDLFHHEGIDPGAAALALKRLAEQRPEARLEVVALEGRGQDQIRLQARVSGEIDRSQLSAEYFDKYNEAAALPYGDLQSLLAAITEKDERIKSLENMVTTAMKSDKFYVETYYDLGKSAEERPPTKKILILTANPHSVDRNRLDAEVREIRMGLERAKKRDQFEIISKWAVRTEDLRRALLDYEPQIVQFSGVGVDNQGLALENETGEVKFVTAPALASLFELFKDKVECVFLNACYSAAQTDAISQHIPYVIGMSHSIGESAALEFAVGFYDALGAGRSIEDAFKVGCISIDLEGLPESLIPILRKRGNHLSNSSA